MVGGELLAQHEVDRGHELVQVHPLVHGKHAVVAPARLLLLVEQVLLVLVVDPRRREEDLVDEILRAAGAQLGVLEEHAEGLESQGGDPTLDGSSRMRPPCFGLLLFHVYVMLALAFVNVLALGLLVPGGFFFVASCRRGRCCRRPASCPAGASVRGLLAG